jgi:transposase InsO family protein
MDPDTYRQYLLFLRDQTVPSQFTEEQVINFRKETNRYVLYNNLLYFPAPGRRHPEGFLRVLTFHEALEALKLCHNEAGHMGVGATIRRLRQSYYWPQLEDDVRSYVKGCRECQLRAPPRSIEPLHSIPVHSPFYRIGIDLIGPLPFHIADTDPRYLVVATDYLTKWAITQPIVKKTAATIADFLFTRVVCIFGCPQFILSDCGTEFRNQVVREVTRRLGIHQQFTSPYHPRTNGLTERLNKTLGEALTRFILDGRDMLSWPEHIPAITFAYNTNRQKTTGYSPAELLFGFQPRAPVDVAIPQLPNDNREPTPRASILSRSARLHWLQAAIPTVRQRIIHTQQHHANLFNSKRHASSESHEFSIGHLVAILRTSHGKLEPRWSDPEEEPWIITDCLNNGSYKVKKPHANTYMFVHRDRLRRWYSEESRLQRPRTDTGLVGGYVGI